MNRTALILSVLLTALVLTIAGGVFYSARSIQKAQAAASTGQTVQVDSQAGIDPQLQQTLLEREASYQKMISEANARLAQDQQTQQALQAQISALQNPPAPANAAQPAVSGVSPETAAQIAGQFLKQTKIYSVEFAAYNGATVYKVTFSSGDIVVVSLDGQIIGSQRAARQNNAGGTVAVHSEEHEHEGGKDD